MSLTWCAVYLRGEVPADFKVPVEGRVGVRALGPWTELALGGLQDPVPAALALSGRVRDEVVAILAQSTASGISVVHCQAGAEVRRLEFAEGSWLAVRGARRPWESAMYRKERLDEMLSDCENDEEVRAAFERADVQTGDTLPWPGELDNILQALGVSERDWNAARDTAPPRVLTGSRRSLTIGVRLGVVATVGLLAGALFATRDQRELLVPFGVVGLLFTAGASVLRRLRVGRWVL